MVCNTQNYWVLGLFPSSGILENTTFRKLDLFPSSDEGGGGGTGSITTCLHIFFSFLCMGAHALGFVGYVCSTNFYLHFYPSSTHMGASSQFLLCNFLVSPAEIAWSQMIK
jgi:hypothetical protein